MGINRGYLAGAAFLLLMTGHLFVVAHKLRLLGYFFRSLGALLIAVCAGVLGSGMVEEAELIVPLLLGAGSYWFGVAMNATFEAETHRRLRKLPRSKYWLCRLDEVTPAPAKFSFWRMLFPGILMACAGVGWAAVRPDWHPYGWSVFIFFGMMIALFSTWLWWRSLGPQDSADSHRSREGEP